MNFWELLKVANRNLFRNKLRTFLTVAAIFVGSFTLTMTNGIGDGFRSYVESQVKNVEGDAVLFVRRKNEMAEGMQSRPDAPREYKDETVTPEPVPEKVDPSTRYITLEQIQNDLSEVTFVKAITPRYYLDGEYITLDGQKKYQVNLDLIAAGITQKTEAGATINGDDQIVLPLSLAKEFDPEIENLIGKRVNIAYKAFDQGTRMRPLEIVGVATKGMMTNSSAHVDPRTAATIYGDQVDPSKAGRFFDFTVQLTSSDQVGMDAVKKKLEEKGYTALTMADQQKQIYDAIGIFKLVMSLVAFIALLAASFGIINTLVIAVLERTKEIGLQKALGMGRGKIFAIFSLESVLIGFWGAVIGIVTAIVIGMIANQILLTAYADSFEGYRLFVFTIPSILIVMLIVCTISFVAGVLPAIRASRLNPIESLRYE